MPLPEVVWKWGAEQDLLSLVAELDEHSVAASARLLPAIESGLEQLRAFPRSAPPFHPPSRRLLLGRTGFAFVFTVEARGLIVHALVHLAQDSTRIEEKVQRLLALR